MAARLLDGAAAARAIREAVAAGVREFGLRSGGTPQLAAVLVGDDPASAVYVRNKIKACGEVGIRSTEIRLEGNTDQDRIAATVRDLNNDADIDGILVQLPLPKGVDRRAIVSTLDPAKDVDGLQSTFWTSLRHSLVLLLRRRISV